MDNYYGTLYVVSTPIGNLKDITLRALEIFKTVDLIAAEDTRHTRKLLTHYNISKPLTSYFEHNKFAKGNLIIQNLKDGKNVALVTDAGTPGISDPGYHLVKLAIENSINIIPVPGASALTTALCVAGITADSFIFEGFIPSQENKRKNYFENIKNEKRTLIYFESPRRLQRTLDDIFEIFGDREIVICRELTKIHEEIIRGKVSEVIDTLKSQQVKGEVTLIISGGKDKPRDIDKLTITEKVLKFKEEFPEVSTKEIVDMISNELKISKRHVYKAVVSLKMK